MFDKDLNIESFTEEITFTMNPDLIDWDLIDEMSYADPSSKEYRKMMKQAGISGRNNVNTVRRWRDDDDCS